jgi:hypothetical protein
MQDVRKQLDDMPRVPLRHRLEHVHYRDRLPCTFDMRPMNIDALEEEMERDEQVNLAFASLSRALERGEKVPIGNPYSYLDGGEWELFSSEVFTQRYC